MKLAISRIASGVLLTSLAVFYSLYGMPTEFRSGSIGVAVMPTTEISSRHDLFSLILLVLGLAVLTAGLITLLKSRSGSAAESAEGNIDTAREGFMKLAVSKLTLGVLLAVFTVIYALYGMPTEFRSADVTISVSPNPALALLHMLISLVLMVLALALWVSGVKGILKSRSGPAGA